MEPDEAPPASGPALTTEAVAPIPPSAQAEAPPTHPPERPPYGIVPDGDTLGVKHIREALADLPWPASKRDLLQRAGAWRIPVTGAHYHPLAQWLEGVPDRRYASVDALVRAIDRARRR